MPPAVLMVANRLVCFLFTSAVYAEASPEYALWGLALAPSHGDLGAVPPVGFRVKAPVKPKAI